jgi:hypothetical protein
VYQDYQGLLPAVESGDHSDVNSPIFQLPIPVDDELIIAGWPKRRERLARAILAVSFQRGALDIADGAHVSHENVAKREYHHVFPVAFLRDQGIDETEASRALNCALITWRTNRTISAKAPVDYLRERADAAVLGEDEVRQRLASHELDYDALVAGDFHPFLVARARAVRERLLDLTRAGARLPAEVTDEQAGELSSDREA